MFDHRAHAQANDVFLGQIGNTNAITIDQTGAQNLVGGASDDLRLNQLGDRNAVTVLQVGEGNGVGRENRVGVAGFLTGQTGVATGLYQIGDGNALDITQRTFRGPGSNSVGAIIQTAPADVPGLSNSAVVVQVGGAFMMPADGPAVSTGPGYHTLGEIAQTFDPGSGSTQPNVMRAEQSGEAQAIEQLRQVGAGNDLSITQAGTANALRITAQDGRSNDAVLDQSGTMNAVGNLVQRGAFNSADVTMDGSGNFVDQIVQAGLDGGAGIGSRVSVSILGDDNGGEGIGGYRAMGGPGTSLGTYSASLEQFGDDNSLSLAIGSTLGGRADGNMFSAGQSGIGNQAGAVMLGDGNLLALRQIGDGNVADILQESTAGRAATGSTVGNSAMLKQIGDGNSIDAVQSGAGNRLDIRLEGDGNDGASALLAGVRELLQTGDDNAAMVEITGNRNLFSIVQTGLGNVAGLTVIGSSNLAAILQTGSANIATLSQTGERNYGFVQQD